MHVLVVFGNARQWRRIVVYVLLHDYVNVLVCILHNLHHTGHIENHKQHTADLQLVALFPSHLALDHFFWLTNTGWMVGCTFRLTSQYLLRFGL